MNFPSINIQGNIISSEILEKIRNEDIKYQAPADFKLNSNIKVRDEIGLAWSEVRSYWNTFKVRKSKLKDTDAGTTETRNLWMMPFLTLMGYDLQNINNAEIVNEKSYAISHRAVNIDSFPVHITGFNNSLDTRSESGNMRLSPHALVQEYLNATEHVYGLASNGKYLRLLRDATRLVRLSYLEFDLEKMMEEELYTDFAILFRLLHFSRMPKTKELAEESWIEYYHVESLASGSRIRDKLAGAVENSIKNLANGFLKHPLNTDIQQAIKNGDIPAETFYLYQLRLIYRMLFIIVNEERNLVYPPSKDEKIQRYRDLYYEYYSVERLRKLASKIHFVDENKYDLWESLVVTFSLFENRNIGAKMGISPLNGQLFGRTALGGIVNLSECKMSNVALLQVIRDLSYFENDQKVLSRVNYGDLDVEEFGSVYESLLEYKAVIHEENGDLKFGFKQGDERSKSGSHYTPEELVKPLIKHSLDYLIEDRGKIIIKEIENRKLKGRSHFETRKQLVAEHLYSLKVCDVACGSGHILLSAARRIAEKAASIIAEEDQPNPIDYHHALRDVIRNCIYGVDKNPLAVELCKVALWLEGHVPGEPLSFLDHRIKWGDSIVGLAHKHELENGIADEAFKSLPDDDKEIAATLRKRNSQERKSKDQLSIQFDTAVQEELNKVLEKFNVLKNVPDHSPEDYEKKEKQLSDITHSKEYGRLKSIADMQVAQFFIAKTEENKSKLCTDATYREYLRQGIQPTGQQPAMAEVLAFEKRFFHWFIEFPQVFETGGFDCILGNPPFLGGKRISGNYGDAYLSILKYYYISTNGGVDLVGYFFRRIFNLLNFEGFLSLISTNTISQGDTRKASLEYIFENKGAINFAIKSTKWIGIASLEVALVSIFKGQWQRKAMLGSKEVNTITPFLDDNISNITTPFHLNKNKNKSFQGTIVLGTGFILESDIAKSLLKLNSSNSKVILPYLNGDDLNSTYDQTATRHIINFFDWDEKYCRENYSDCFNIVSDKVKPQRAKLKDKGYREKWWQYGRRAVDMYDAIKNKSKVIAIAQVTKPVAFDFVETHQVLDAKLIVFDLDTFSSFSLLQSTLHNSWAWNYCTTLETRLSYAPTSIFETFPFPQNNSPKHEQKLKLIGEQYYEFRKEIMLKMQLGLTKTYNAFHAKKIQNGIMSATLQGMDKKEIEKKYDYEVLYLWNHLQKSLEPCSFEESVTGIIKLRELHVEMDNAVLNAYGWSDIKLDHDFYEVEYLPENDRIRYTIHPDARKEILKRLLELNHKIHDEEVKAGLWDKKTPSKSEKSKKDKSQTDAGLFGYGGLFEQEEK